MSSTTQTADKAEESVTTGGHPGGAFDLIIPAKREHDDEVQFISSQPVKKVRLAGHEETAGGQIAAPSAAGPHQAANVQGYIDGSVPDRSVSAVPLGLPAHMPTDPLSSDRGTSLPVLESYRFPSLHATTSAPPPASAAVSPKHLCQTMPPGVVHGTQSDVGEASAPQAINISHVSCLEVREPGDNSSANLQRDFSNLNHARNLHSPSETTNANAMDKNPLSARTPIVAAASLTPLANSAPGSGHWQAEYMPLIEQDPVSSAMLPTDNFVPPPQGLSSLNSNFMSKIPSPSISTTSHRQDLWTGSWVSARITPDWNTVSTNRPTLYHPRPVRPAQEPMSSVISSLDAVSSQQIPAQRPPCVACLSARHRGQLATSQGLSPGQVHRHSHSNPRLRPSQLPLWPGAFSLTVQPSSSKPAATQRNNVQGGSLPGPVTGNLPPHAFAYGQTPPSSGIHSWSSQHPGQGVSIDGMMATPAYDQRGADTNQCSKQSVNGLFPVRNNAVPTSAQEGFQSNFTRPPSTLPPSTVIKPTVASSSTSRRPAQPRKQSMPSQPEPRARAQSQRPPTARPPVLSSQQHPPPSTTATVTATALSSAATRASSRKTHASNLLVDVAELAGDIFPYDVVARQHGTLPRKVAEALAAVVQVPLLRCATDKRRTGKLGSDRMREFREARKGWLALVREWEREDRAKGADKDAEGETDDDEGEVVRGGCADRGRGVEARAGHGVAARAAAQGNVKGPVDPRAVVQPGEPSALDVALMLPPTEMPSQMLRDGFFLGPW